MATVVEQKTMSKPVGRPRKGEERDDVTIRIERGLGGMLKILAATRGVPVAELASDFMRERLTREYGKLMREYEGGGGQK